MATLNKALAHELQRQGVTSVFGLLGEDVMVLAIELERLGINFYSTRHESTAVGMADGYARVTGDLGVAIVSRGPGLTNALTNMVLAAKSNSRVLVITSDSDQSLRGSIYTKYVDQKALYVGAEVPFVEFETPETAVADLAAVCDRIREGVTIVANFPGTVLDQEAGDSPSTTALPAAPLRVAPDPDAISAIADLVQESFAFTRPVILAGRGAVDSDAKPALLRIGEACGALLATTLMGRELFAGEDYNVGICGTFSIDPTVELLQEADWVLAFGSSLDQFTTAEGGMFPKARVIRFDRAPDADESGSVPVELFVEGDVRLSAEALADELERRSHHVTGFRRPEIPGLLSSFEPRPSLDEGRPGLVDPRLAMARIDRFLPRDKNVAIDGSHHMVWSIEHLAVAEPRAFVLPIEFYSIGTTTGIALGAAIASPDRITVYDAGDAGMMMTLAEIETAARYNLPLIVIVSNDEAIGSELHQMELWNLPTELGRIPTPSFAAVGEALGADGVTIASLEDVEQLRGMVEKLERPLVIDLRVNPDIVSDDFFRVEINALRQAEAQGAG